MTAIVGYTQKEDFDSFATESFPSPHFLLYALPLPPSLSLSKNSTTYDGT